MTKIVNIYSLVPGWENDPDYVYIGRKGKGRDGYFGNPFILGRDGDREDVFTKYVDWLAEKMQTDAEFASRLFRLKGKTLVCFCSPKLCHGDAIISMVDYE